MLLFAAAPFGAQSPPPRDVDLDHIILSTPSLAQGIEEFTRLSGVVPKRGGQHPLAGTENALITLGSGHYLELLAPIVARSDSSNQHLTPTGWALHTTALPALIDRVRSAGLPLLGPLPGSREMPDGTLLQWRTANTGGASGLELAPFFIEWAAGTPHPSTTSPEGCRLVKWELVASDTGKLQAFFRAAGYRADVRAGPTAARRLTIECPKGQVVFSSERPRR
ncbi:MAG: VOC family protein [Gemmatimonadales bacterium]